jgi:hypothetical protein
MLLGGFGAGIDLEVSAEMPAPRYRIRSVAEGFFAPRPAGRRYEIDVRYTTHAGKLHIDVYV